MGEFIPLDNYPDLEKLKKQYEGRSIKWCFELNGKNGTKVVNYITIDLYRVAAAVEYEKQNKAQQKDRRKEFRRLIKEMYYKNEISDNKNLNAVLLSYCCTYDGPSILLSDPENPDVGIIVTQDVDKEVDLGVALLYKNEFIETYDLMLSGKKLAYIIGKIPGRRG